MPVIPPEYIGTNAFPDRPPLAEVNPESFGRDAAELGRLGGEFGDMGSRLMNARKNAMENDAASNAATGDTAWLPQAKEELRRKYRKTDAQGNDVVNPDGTIAYDVTGYSDELKRQMDQRLNSNLDTMPTGDAQRLYRDRTQHQFNSAYAEAYDWENQTRVKTLQGNIDVRSQTRDNGILNSDNPERDTILALQATEQDINASTGKDGIIDPNSAQAETRKLNKATFDSMFGAFTKNRAAALEGLKVVNRVTDDPSDPFGQRIAQSLAPQDLVNHRNKLLSVIGKQNTETNAALKARYDGTMSGLTSTDPKISGNVTAPQVKALITDILGQANLDNKHTQANERVVALAMGMAGKTVRDQMIDMSEDEKYVYDGKMQEEYEAQLRNVGIDPTKDSTFALDKYRKQNDISRTLWDKMQQARKHDVNDFYDKNHPNAPGTVAEGLPNIDRIKARQDYSKLVGLDGGGFLTHDEAGKKAKQIIDQGKTDPDGAVNTMERIKANSGEYADKVAAELISKGKMPGYFKLAMNASSPAVARDIIELSQHDNDKALRSTETMPEADQKELRESVAKEWKSSEDAIMGVSQNPYNQRVSNELQHLVENKAIMYKKGGEDSDAAAAHAANDIFRNDHHIVGNAYMPKQIGGVYTNKSLVETEMASIHDADPHMFQVPGGDYWGSTPAERDATTREAVRTGKWVTRFDKKHPEINETQAVFMVKSGSGRWDTVLNDEFGNPVTIDYARAQEQLGEHGPQHPAWMGRMNVDGSMKYDETSGTGPEGRTGEGAHFWDWKNLKKAPDGKLQEQSITPDAIKPGTSPAPKETAADKAGRNLASADQGIYPQPPPESYADTPDGPDAGPSDPSLPPDDNLPQDANAAKTLPSDLKGGKPRETSRDSKVPLKAAPAKAGPPRPVTGDYGEMAQTVGPGGSHVSGFQMINGIMHKMINYSGDELHSFINEASAKEGVSAQLLKNMFLTESSGDQNIRDSNKGAQGFAQIMPATAKGLGMINGLIKNADGQMEMRADSKDAKVSIAAGAHYLRQQIDYWTKRGYENPVRLGVASYNAGAGTVANAIAKNGGRVLGFERYLPLQLNPTKDPHNPSYKKHDYPETKLYLKKILGS